MKPFLISLLLLAVGCAPAPAAPPLQFAAPAPTAASAERWIAPMPTRTTDCHAHDGLPDTACSPGATDPRVTQANIAMTICVAGYSATVRPSVSVTDRIKRSQLVAYGFGGQPLSDFEEDHIVSLEIGGAPADPANLWPEPYASEDGARVKDRLENDLHKKVCAGQIRLAEAQQMIATDWVSAARDLGLFQSP